MNNREWRKKEEYNRAKKSGLTDEEIKEINELANLYVDFLSFREFPMGEFRGETKSDRTDIYWGGKLGYDTQPLDEKPTIDIPEKGLKIPVDKTKFRLRFVNENEKQVDVIIEPKEK